MKNQKYTLKQIREWMRKLEENRYRRRYMIDAKRVHHYANLGEDTDLPTNLQRKSPSTYSRQKQLAKQFKKFVREQANLAKKEKKVNTRLREGLRKLIKEELGRR
jgi:hypothetical protein